MLSAFFYPEHIYVLSRKQDYVRSVTHSFFPHCSVAIYEESLQANVLPTIPFYNKDNSTHAAIFSNNM